MDGKRCLGEIVSEINNRFEGVPGTALEEITAFVDKLSESGFVGYELKNGR
jgi:hypothetical protein